MNENVIRRLFPNASRSTFEANRELPHPCAQRDQAQPLEQAVPREERRMVRIMVRFTGFRVRPLDPDSFAGSTKDLLDALKHASLIPDDSFWHITLQTEQVKIKKWAEEKTEIEIIYPSEQTKGTTCMTDT